MFLEEREDGSEKELSGTFQIEFHSQDKLLENCLTSR